MRCFDFCYTIVNLNTTYSFIDYCVSRSGYYYKARLLFVKIISKLLLLFGLINSSQHSKMRLYVLKGFHIEKLRCLSREFSAEINRNLNSDIFSILESIKSEKVLIVSNALGFLIEDFFESINLDCDVIGSTISEGELFFSGKYQLYVPDEGKVNVLLGVYPGVSVSEFYTDDFVADKDLVSFSDISHLVSEGRVV